jgi:hypothetical protein
MCFLIGYVSVNSAAIMLSNLLEIENVLEEYFYQTCIIIG